MNTILYNTALNATGDEAVPVYWTGSVDEHPVRPFIVLRNRGNLPGEFRKAKKRGYEVWVHDAPGSYSNINRILGLIAAAFESSFPQLIWDELDNLVAAVAQADWQSDSPDLQNEDLKTICRMSSWTVVGKDENDV